MLSVVGCSWLFLVVYVVVVVFGVVVCAWCFWLFIVIASVVCYRHCCH